MSKYNDLLDKLIEYTNKDYLPMHMPGTKRNDSIYDEEAKALSRLDITEIEGFDNLHDASGVILDIQERAQRLYKTDLSLLLVNGSTAGILAAISGVCHKGDRILVARNCHVSVYNALYLNELRTEYISPQIDENTGMFLGISLDEIKAKVEKESLKEDRIKADKDISVEDVSKTDKDSFKAVVITSPTYEGRVSQIREIANYLHEKGIVLIVDEAHGAHFNFHKEFPESAISQGADVVINSIHKTLPAPTQTALLHLNSDLINYDRVKRYWNIYQSTSPSYLLMAGIARALSFVEIDGECAYKEYVENLKQLIKEIAQLKNIELAKVDDMSKIVLKSSKEGARAVENFGKWIFDRLLEDYHIQLEMASFDYAIAMTAVGDNKSFYNRFIGALRELDSELERLKNVAQDKKESTFSKEKKELFRHLAGYEKLMEAHEAINEADLKGYDLVSLNDLSLINRISVNAVLLYPPGMPVINSGELITEDKIKIIKKALELDIEVIGLNDDLIKVLKQKKNS